MNSSPRTLQGKNALVTGAGTGIGKAIALHLAREGAAVALVGRRRDPLETVAREITAASGRALVESFDVSVPAAVERGVGAILKAFGSLDVLVNNAGVGGPNGCLAEGPDRWDAIVRTNLDGVFLVTRAALRGFRDGGRVVNVSSVLGKFGVPGYTAYCASKHAVIGFTKALALEGAPRRITVNAICPGWTETEMAREGMDLIAKGTGTSYDEARKAALALVPLGRIVEPTEVAGLVGYLCSEAAAAVTGQAWSICGGSTMG